MDKTKACEILNATVRSSSVVPSDAVIVIGRQFGSGGRRIGKIIASNLGMAYYDTELLAKAAECLGVKPEVFQEHDEKKPSLLRTLLQGSYGIPDNFHTIGLSGEAIYAEQSKVIRELCSKGPCVIVGRTADYILRGHPNLLSVFLHGPVDHRAGAIVARGEAKDIDEAIAMARQRDRKREAYYNYYTGSDQWGKAENYHVSIDTSVMKDEEVANLIMQLAHHKFK